jgi:hypothetical protein
MARPRRLAPAVLTLLPSLALGPAAAQIVRVGAEFRVNSYTTGSQSSPSVASAADARFVVAWRGGNGQDGDLEGIFGQRYDSAGVPVGLEFRVNSYTTLAQGGASVAATGDGRFVVVWESTGQDGSGEGVFGQRYDTAGAPAGLEFPVNSTTTSDQSRPRVALAADGRFVVVWESDDGDGQGIFGQRYDSTGAPAGPEFRVNSFTSFDQRSPAVAVAGDGRFVVAWQSYDQDGSAYGVFGQRYGSTGAAAGPEFRVNTFTTGRQYSASVAAATDGRFVVAWRSGYSQDGDGDGVFGQRYDSAGAPAGPEFRVNSYTTLAQGAPSVAAASDGSFVVAWESYRQDGSEYAASGQRYDSAGEPVGPEFRVNSYTTFNQRSPAVALAADGKFVVAWASANQDGDAEGVFGQRFRDDVLFRDGFEGP